jgi:hypothetical protein
MYVVYVLLGSGLQYGDIKVCLDMDMLCTISPICMQVSSNLLSEKLQSFGAISSLVPSDLLAEPSGSC